MESLWIVDTSLVERLVGPEAHDGQSKRVHGQLIVLHVLAENVGHTGRPSFPLEFGMIRWVRVHLFKLDPRRIWGQSKIVKHHTFDLHIHIRKGAVVPIGERSEERR